MALLPNGPGTGNSTDSPYQLEEQPVFPEQRAEQAVVRVLVPAILVVGVFGNLATIFVMRRFRDQQQGSSQRGLLMTLAVSDYLLVQTGMLHWLLFRFFRVDLRLWHVVVCKLYYWLLYTAGMQSAWLVTCVTVQRAVSVTWPHRVRAACTWRRTCVVIAFVTLVPCVVNVYLLVGMRITDDNVCDAETAEYHDVFAVWAWVDMLLASVFPSLCLIVCDVILCLALFKAASVSGVVVVEATSDAGGADRHKRVNRRKTASGVTAMCLALSATFLVLTLPVCVQHIWINFMYFDLSPRDLARFSLTSSVFHLLWFLNSAVNFFLYCITGTKFRQEFLNWICCRKGQSSSSSASSSHAWSVKLTHVSN